MNIQIPTRVKTDQGWNLIYPSPEPEQLTREQVINQINNLKICIKKWEAARERGNPTWGMERCLETIESAKNQLKKYTQLLDEVSTK